MKLWPFAVLLASIDAGEVNLDTPEITKTDVQAYRKARFLQNAESMASELPAMTCHALVNVEQEIAMFECETENKKKFAALFVWQDGEWRKTPGILTD